MGVQIKGANYVPGLDLHVVSDLVEGSESLCRSEVLHRWLQWRIIHESL
jgi:hypothetical protein